MTNAEIPVPASVARRRIRRGAFRLIGGAAVAFAGTISEPYGPDQPKNTIKPFNLVAGAVMLGGSYFVKEGIVDVVEGHAELVTALQQGEQPQNTQT